MHGQRVGSLSVIVPVYNGGEWVEPMLARLRAALHRAPGFEPVEIVFVDDGSSDGTGDALDALARTDPSVKVVHQANSGRFLARRAGLDAAEGDFVLFIDIRVFIDPDALAYVAGQLAQHPERVVWNAHCEIDLHRNPYARFWHAVTFAAWRRYLADPRLVDYGVDDFDLYPKGTTCFLAPRASFVDAYDAFTTHYDDLRRVNDDTSLIRSLAARHRVFLGPGFSCTYHARQSLRQFLTHSHARGLVFVDGHLRAESRYRWFIVAFLIATFPGLVVALLYPQVVLVALPALALAALAGLRLLGVPAKSAATFAALLVPFGASFGTGIWRGAALAVRTRLRRGAS